MKTTTFFFIFVPILAILLLSLNLLLAPHNPYEEKDSVFECGFTSFLGQNREEFEIQFFLVAIAFLLFDMEVLTMFPLAVNISIVQLYGLSVGLAFFTIVTFGFVFEIGKEALTIESRQTLSHNSGVPRPHAFSDTRLQSSILLRIFKGSTKNINNNR